MGAIIKSVLSSLSNSVSASSAENQDPRDSRIASSACFAIGQTEVDSEDFERLKWRISFENIASRIRRNQNLRLLRFLESGLFSDITIKVESEPFTAHRCILNCFERYLSWAGIALDPSRKFQVVVVKRGTAKQHKALLEVMYGRKKMLRSEQDRESHEFKSVYHSLYFTDRRQAFRELLVVSQNDSFSDLVIESKEYGATFEPINVHKVLLGASSPYLAAYFSLPSNHSDRLLLPMGSSHRTVNESTVQNLLHAIYHGELRFSHIDFWREVLEIFKLAKEWKCREIADLCSTELVANRLTKDNVKNILFNSFLQQELFLYCACIDFSLDQVEALKGYSSTRSVLPDGVLQPWSVVDLYFAAKERKLHSVMRECCIWAQSHSFKDFASNVDSESLKKLRQFAKEIGFLDLERMCDLMVEPPRL